MLQALIQEDLVWVFSFDKFESHLNKSVIVEAKIN
jgi:hypothetical protein